MGKVTNEIFDVDTEFLKTLVTIDNDVLFKEYNVNKLSKTRAIANLEVSVGCVPVFFTIRLEACHLIDYNIKWAIFRMYSEDYILRCLSDPDYVYDKD